MLYDEEGNIDPKNIKQVIETDSIKTTILTKKATKEAEEELKDEIAKGMIIEVEGEEVVLIGYRKFEKADTDCILYVKQIPEKQQIQYILSDHPDAEPLKQHFEKHMCAMAITMGYELIDMRPVMVESMGAIKREKGVQSLDELSDVLTKEDELAEVTETNEVDEKPEQHPLSEYPIPCYRCLKARNLENCEYYHTGDIENCRKIRESLEM